MGRRRWRLATIAAFLLFVARDTQCQDENGFYYTPERNFAQVQPPIFPNSRPTSFFEHGDSYRAASTAQQPLYNDGRVRFASSNYNQNPSPFQVPTGRSQSGSQYYINQPDFTTSQRQRFRPALPYNFQIQHPASTKRPDVSQIHSAAYQNDPSKPETFLGQITINNPDIDYLQNNGFKNIPFDTNSLKSNGQSGHIAHDDEFDNDDQDIFDQHKVTTYNPTKLANKQKISNKPNNSRFSHFDPPTLNVKKVLQNVPADNYKINSNFPPSFNIPELNPGSSTEYKPLLDLEPLLEDDISDLSSFRELMKNNQESFDVQVIKSNNSENSDDSKSDASSMNTDNMANDSALMTLSIETTPKQMKSSTTTTTEKSSELTDDAHEENLNEEEEGEYVEYYDEEDKAEVKHTTTAKATTTSAEPVTDIYDEYDATEEPEETTVIPVKINSNNSFEVLAMEPNNTLVKDDNFKQFIDSDVIDDTEVGTDNDTTAPSLRFTFSKEKPSLETPSILGQEVVSVVTTKSVVNGTISIPDVTYPPTPKTAVTSVFNNDTNESPITTESWIVVASVQTSRSVSGARFLPFPTVEQEEKKQVLTEEDEENVTHNPMQDSISVMNSSSSTENINDKLDSIQSELSSAVLSGNINKENKNIELITESTTEPTTSSTTTSTTTTTTPSAVNVFTLKSTQFSVATERSSPDPLPVQIKKFAPRVTTSTTPKPKKKLVTVMDDLSGLLPPGYKSRQSYKDKRTSTTTTTTASTTTTTPAPKPGIGILNITQGRSSGISSKNKVIILDDKSLLPKEYKPKQKTQDDLFKKVQNDDFSKLLPPGYKPDNANNNTKQDVFKTIEKIDISAFLPKGFKLDATPTITTTTTTTTEKNKVIPKLPTNAVPVDISAFLPPGFNLNSSESDKPEEVPLSKFKVADISSFLPPGFNSNSPQEEESTLSTTTASSGSFKVVFPSRPGGKASRKSTTQKSSIGPPPVTPKIQKGWPTRASTEFTGWPSPSTTPFSIDRLLEQQRNATSTTPLSEISTESTTRRRVSTTTTTPAPPQPTTPGVCRHECDIAATIKIVSGVKWVPEFLDHHTKEWQKLAREVKHELNSVYSKSDLLSKWFKGVRIDGFSQGSVLVDYFIELNNVQDKIDTLQLKKIFHKSLSDAKAGSMEEDEELDTFDPDVMLGDQPDEDRMKKSNEKMTKNIDKSAGKLEMGKFVMDPAYTEFIVLPKHEEPTITEPEEESLLPQWGIAVIVIALASLLFVVIFGVTVLVNRQKSTKTKQPIPLSEDMLRELDKSHMGGFDDMHQLKERDLPYLPSGKRMSTAFIEQLAYPNPGDSWRSEWTPQLQKYMSHYTPDSGRGSQIYGTTGNGYGGSQLYGQTGAGSQVYGYTGEFPRSHYSRRRSDYDSNF
ncbi:mucin-5AC [Bicyclus anynana]|uniref:Mucin-5AC n=1 Tax=Bicyclus anynana TaxID=110368 RepID=A0ABM3M7M9_BICAN|nr:mucin-5AC [Bicyclus anynana]XP_052747449.1 mucin-5AC [Bicyclus anynana]